MEAYNLGDYETALKEWLMDASQGYAGAQFNLGLMYDNGFGVSENQAEAVRGYHLAAGHGDTAGKTFAEEGNTVASFTIRCPDFFLE